jgi:hypothetical protein
MSKIATIKCDGCNEKTAELRSGCWLPRGWSHVEIKVGDSHDKTIVDAHACSAKCFALILRGEIFRAFPQMLETERTQVPSQGPYR